MGAGDVNLIAKIAPYNDGFVGMVDAKQVIGGASNTLPDTVTTRISKLDSTLATGIVKVTTTTGALSSIVDNSTNWNTAYSWGNHATAGYLTSLSGALLVTGATTGATSQAQVFTNGVTLSNMTAGSVLFAGTSGVVSQDNSNLFWDDANNRFGIGTTSPAYPLHVVTSGADVVGFTGASTATSIANATSFVLRNSNTTNGNYSAIVNRNGVAGYNASLEFINVNHDDTGSASGDLRLILNNAGTIAERVRFKSDGKVGIGTSSPTAQFEVVGGILATGGNLAATNNGVVQQVITSASDTPWYYGYLSVNRARGTVTSPSSISAGDYLGGVNYYGYTNTYSGAGALLVQAESLVGNYIKGKFLFNISAGVDSGANANRLILATRGSTFYAENSDASLTKDSDMIGEFLSATIGNKISIGATSTSPYGCWIQSKNNNYDSVYHVLALNPVGGNVGVGVMDPDSLLAINGDIAIVDGMTAPSTKSGYAKIYVDSADGDLKIKFGDGTVKTIVTDS